MWMEHSEEKSSILVVDDEPMNITALSHILCPEYTVYVAKDGFDAVEVAKELLPNLILLDILMPGMNGYEVLTALREATETKEIPVIFVSGLSDAADEEKGMALGASDYINKPFRASSVKLRVKNQLMLMAQKRIINHLTTSDNLTNTSNRRFFNTRLGQEWQRAVRENSPISLLLLDIDNFKEHNRIYGHRQGDVTLQTVADIINYALRRPFDLAGRWSGEQFAVLLPNTPEDGAAKVAEMICRDIEQKPILCDNGDTVNVTISIGVNTVRPPRYDTSLVYGFVSETEKALQHAKKTGKNKIVPVHSLQD